MRPNGRDDGRRERRLALLPVSEAREATGHEAPTETHLVFDFAGLQGLGFADLALVLTARLHAEPGETVWVRQIPYETWQVLRALGLDHLFHVYPGPGDDLN